MDALRNFLSGKKMYLVGFGLILNAVIQYLGDNDLGKLIKGILEGLGVVTAKAAIAKTV